MFYVCFCFDMHFCLLRHFAFAPRLSAVCRLPLAGFLRPTVLMFEGFSRVKSVDTSLGRYYDSSTLKLPRVVLYSTEICKTQ